MKYFLPKDDQFVEVEVREERGHLLVQQGQRTWRVEVLPLGDGYFSLLLDHRSLVVWAQPGKKEMQLQIGHRDVVVPILDGRQKMESEIFGADPAGEGGGDIRAPMPGMVLKVEVAAGDSVAPGQPLLVMEAMKMENEIRATEAGTVAEILVQPQQAVEKDDLLIRITSGGL